MGAGHRRGDRPEGDGVPAAGLSCGRLRDGHIRGAAARPARGRGCVRAGAERGRGAACRATGTCRPSGPRSSSACCSARSPPGGSTRPSARMSARLQAAGFDEAMAAALAAEDVLAADETPVNVLDKTPVPARDQDGEADPEEKDGKAAAGAPHVLIVRTPDERLTWLRPRLPPQGQRRRRHPRRVHRAPDDRRVHRLPAPSVPDRGHPAVLPARHPPLPRRAETRPRRPAVLGRGHHRGPRPGAPGRRGRPRPRRYRPRPAGSR